MTDLARYGSLEAAILACAKGDRMALRAIYEAESARLLGIAFRMLKRRAAAEDVLQDTFLTLWEQAHRFDGRPGYGRAWLSTLLRATARSTCCAARQGWISWRISNPLGSKCRARVRKTR